MLTQTFPTAILENTATKRFHPISYRLAPLPGNDTGQGGKFRHKSIGHHTDGFDTLESANQWIKENDNATYYKEIILWDGEGIPADIHWFELKINTT